jgi:hypothetical protein
MLHKTLKATGIIILTGILSFAIFWVLAIVLELAGEIVAAFGWKGLLIACAALALCFYFFFRDKPPLRIKHPVDGTLTFLGPEYDSPPDGRCKYWIVTVVGIISAPGIPECEVKVTKALLENKYPDKGDVLPVTVELTNPNRFNIRWEAVPEKPDPAVSGIKLVPDWVAVAMMVSWLIGFAVWYDISELIWR